MTEKEIMMEELDEAVKCTDEQLEMMSWKMEDGDKQMVVSGENQDILVLLNAVSEVRSEYQQLRRELLEVQALQRELSGRLRAQLRLVHGRFARLRQRLQATAAAAAK